LFGINLSNNRFGHLRQYFFCDFNHICQIIRSRLNNIASSLLPGQPRVVPSPIFGSGYLLPTGSPVTALVVVGAIARGREATKAASGRRTP
jgi:hypothetical protein